jgi:hypothetical protein
MTSIEILTPEIRETCLEARDKILALQTKILRLELSLSCVLPIAEKHGDLVELKTCAFIRQTIGERVPPRGKPVLVVDNGRGK